MYEFFKAHKMLCCIGIIVIVSLFCWFVFGVHNNGGADGRIGEQLERLADEQRNAAESLERVQRGLDDSTERVADIESRVREHSEAVGRITDSVERGQERIRTSEEIARDSESRITECLRICSEVRKTEKPD